LIYVDADFLESAVGTPGWQRRSAQKFFLRSFDRGTPLCTSALVLHEICVACNRDGLWGRAAAVRMLVRGHFRRVLTLEVEDVYRTERLRYSLPLLSERSLLTYAICQRRGVGGIATHDRELRRTFKYGALGMRRTAAEIARVHQDKWRREHDRGTEPPAPAPWPG
jgi:predicted nucleic acid-binding protein